MPRKHRPYRPNHAFLVPITWKAASRAWFVYAGEPYAVATCSSTTFKAFILSHCPLWRYSEEYLPILRQKTLEMPERWFLLCSMIEAEQPLTLYNTREEACEGVYHKQETV